MAIYEDRLTKARAVRVLHFMLARMKHHIQVQLDR
jgi:hypothetical protein